MKPYIKYIILGVVLIIIIGLGSFFLGYYWNKNNDEINETSEISNIIQKVNFGNLVYYIPNEYNYLIESNQLRIINSDVWMYFQSGNINYEAIKLRKDEWKKSFEEAFNISLNLVENYNDFEGLYYAGKYNNYQLSIIMYPLTSYHIIISVARSLDNGYDDLVTKQMDILKNITINKDVSFNEQTLDLLSIIEGVLQNEQ